MGTKWERTGACKRCGECCKKMMRAVSMLRGTNFFDPNNWCKYLHQSSEDHLWYCEIQEAYEEGDSELLEMLPEGDLRYWDENCRDYPSVDDPGQVPPVHSVLGGCGFKFTKVSVRNGVSD